MQTLSLLQKLGLSDKEARIFLTTTELGSATAYVIAKRAKIKRTTAYAVLDQLLQKKYLTSITSKGKKIYSAIRPEALIDRAAEGIDEAKRREDCARELIPLLQTVYNQSPNQPNVIFYQGRQGLRDLHNELLHDKSVKTMYYLTAVETIEHALGKNFFKGWIQKRIQQGIKSIGIRNKTKEIRDIEYTGKGEFLRDYRFAPGWVNIPLGLYISGDKVAIISSKAESFGLLVESSEFSTLMKNLFDALWRLSEETLV